MPLGIPHVRHALDRTDVDIGAARRLLAPTPRGRNAVTERELRPAAALLFLFPRGARLHFVLTLRPSDVPEHGGQVSLPGGRPHAGETPWQTATREAEEEIGLPRETVEPLGVLRPVYIPVTHTRLSVVVGHGKAPDAWVPEAREVAEIREVPLAHLLESQRQGTHTRKTELGEREVPAYELGGLIVWGATAIALSELAARLS